MVPVLVRPGLRGRDVRGRADQFPHHVLQGVLWVEDDGDRGRERAGRLAGAGE